MVRSRITQISFKAVYLLLMLIGILDSLGAFTGTFFAEFYVFFTNQSNCICFVIAAVELGIATGALRRGEKAGFTSSAVLIHLKYLASVWILLTCLVANVLLSSPFTAFYWSSISNPILHLLGPVMFILDYILFTERGRVHAWSIPLVVCYPYLYIAFVYTRVTLLPSGYEGITYPYFFLDPRPSEEAGSMGSVGSPGMVVLWVTILTGIFLAFAALLYFCNRIEIKKQKLEVAESQKKE